jgi:hypothetical protein
VDNVLVVQVLEAVQSLAHKVADEAFLECTIVEEEGRNRTTRDVLKENVQVIAVAGRVEVLDNVGVLETLEQLDLALERVHHIALLLVLELVARRALDLLDGHEKTGLRVHAEED